MFVWGGFTNEPRLPMDDSYYQRKRAAAYRTYRAEPLIHSPFFNEDIVLGLEGFRHLWLSARGERMKEEQIQRFLLLPLGIQVLKTATTLQTYRQQPTAANTPGSSCGPRGNRKVQWWGFVALFVKQRIKVRVVVRKVGEDKLHFWSVMLYTKRTRRVTPQ